MNTTLILLLISLISFSLCSTATKLHIPRLSPIGDLILHKQVAILSENQTTDLKTFYYNQTLDHFNYNPQSYSTFQQRYLINFNHWGGPNSTSPIFAYLGAEASIDGDVEVIGFLSDNAVQFNALIVYIEHRYYGKSMPFGSREEALRNASTRGYFNSAQAIADYAEILIHVKKQYLAENCPVIVIGGSYGGMLASWFRLKYPHVALGALASSAPILYFDDIIAPQDGYYSIVAKDFREASETCHQTIRDSWSEIHKVASQPDGLLTLSNIFNTCKPLNTSSELENYLMSLYAVSAQYNRPPKYPVTVVCGGIDRNGSDYILNKIFAGVVAYVGNKSCYINAPANVSETSVGWAWQRCSEMVMPIGIENNTMFPDDPFVLSEFIEYCTTRYGVSPRPNWVTTYYGGHDIKLILQRFGSNIIFSNGLRDPYSTAGVLENISPSIVALTTANGSHCLDILRANTSTDPEWLVEQRKIEVKIIADWIREYNADLKELK